ncbi:MAG: DUF1508 domain-containing protein [Halobacteriales archaeon]|nr:DUF1508 domain-containing protein [Halobacteriales archaeon]
MAAASPTARAPSPTRPRRGARPSGSSRRRATPTSIQYRRAAASSAYPDDGDWRWRLVTDDRELLAASGDGYADEGAAEAAVEAAFATGHLAADLIEFEHAAFQRVRVRRPSGAGGSSTRTAT